ncbi:MAG: DMT family transporter [Desulfobacterales bacterium]|nr:DMT family transporter [Desulfobacterales bacterium]
MLQIIARPIAGLFLGALIISFSSVFVKLSQVNPMVSAFYRVFFGCIFLSLMCGVKNEFKKMPLKQTLLAILCGLVFGVDLFCWHFSIDYVGPGLATILGNCQVFVLALAGWLIYKEKLGVSFMLSLPLALIGLYMVIGMDTAQLTPQYIAGIGFGILTALSYSVFILLIRYVQSGKDSPIFFYQVVVTAAGSVFLCLVVIGAGHSFAIPSFSSLAALLGLGVLSQALAWVMISHFLPGVEASRAGLILLLQPALSFVWDVILFNRETGWAGWIGVTIVLIAIYMGMARKH